MKDNGIETRLVYGFLDAGKTTYIRDCIRNDFFHKYGTTLILCFEQGEEEYDPDALAEKRTSVAYYDGKEDVGAFCRNSIEAHHPDRIYVEMNTMMQDLRDRLPDCMRVAFVSAWIDWKTLDLYFVNFRQMMGRMVSESHQVTFRGCPSKEKLEPYSQAFRLMNPAASYLREDPMGYHERAFDLFLPFSLEEPEITITEDRYLVFWLDAYDHPEHYAGKRLRFSDPLELRRTGADGPWSAGRVVMTCCMADLQFMAFELRGGSDVPDAGWVVLDAAALVGSDEYGRKKVQLRPELICCAQPPEPRILDSRRGAPGAGADAGGKTGADGTQTE